MPVSFEGGAAIGEVDVRVEGEGWVSEGGGKGESSSPLELS